MNAHVALSVVLPLLIVLSALLVSHADDRIKRKADPPGARDVEYDGPPGKRNKINGRRGPPGGSPPGLSGGGPPGLSGGGPPGLSGGGPPGLTKPGKWQTRPNNENDYEKPNKKPSVKPDDKPTVDNHDDIEPSTLSPPVQIRCRKNEFRCGSSECLPETVRCDGKFDCRDSSDEQDCTKPENEPGCVLPERPEGGSYELGGCGKPCSKRPGDKVPRNSILTYTCRHNYILNGSAVSVCANDKWYNLPSCLRTCSPLSSTTVNILCTYQGNEVPCTDRIKPGTVATLSCKSSYKLPVTNDPAYRTVTCLEDGLWDRRLFRCLPECGIPIAQGNTLVVNGFDAKLGVFPWHVGIYNKKAENEYEQICGGTLISNNLVVSAAHCFYDEVYNVLQDKSKYAVAAGKNCRDWDEAENYAQKSMVDNISLPERYIGARGNFAADIAILKLVTPIELTALVRPICIDWEKVYARTQLQVGQSGKAVGWGKTIKGAPSKNLQEVNMPYVPFGQCLGDVPEDFRGYITADKFCAGRLNGSSLCEGDSGGGLGFETGGTWYLRGVVSVSPVKDDKCDYHSYTVFTSTDHFRDWIRDIYTNT